MWLIISVLYSYITSIFSWKRINKEDDVEEDQDAVEEDQIAVEENQDAVEGRK